VIDVRRMVNGEKMPIAQTVAVSIPAGYDTAAMANVTLAGSLAKVESNFLLEAQAEATVIMACGRCLRAVAMQIAFDVEERFCEDPTEADWPVTEHSIDIVPVLTDNFLPQLPMKVLCAQDCKGLCRHCGKDLNEGSCGCREEESDERFAVLKQWFSESDTDIDMDSDTNTDLDTDTI